MILLRSVAFNAAFYVLTLVLSSYGVLLRVFAPGRVLALARLWARLATGLLRVLCGIRLELSGAEHLPAEGPALIASRHSSAFDTMVWMLLVPRPSYVMKRELLRIPLFGPLLRLGGMIPVDRGGGAPAMRQLLEATEAAVRDGRQIVIFPEGTRVPFGECRRLKHGIVAMAHHTGLAVIPVATDSGRAWGRHSFARRPGVIRVMVRPKVPASLGREEMLAALEREIHRLDREPEAGAVDNSVA